jgi:hypothetical protein
MRLTPLLGCSPMILLLAVAPAAAMPRESVPPTGKFELARVVCDAWGRCWEQPSYSYYSRPRYEYDYGDDYDEDDYDDYYSRPRPPTKWERKGFCPPGQRKKGNC